MANINPDLKVVLNLPIHWGTTIAELYKIINILSLFLYSILCFTNHNMLYIYLTLLEDKVEYKNRTNDLCPYVFVWFMFIIIWANIYCCYLSLLKKGIKDYVWRAKLILEWYFYNIFTINLMQKTIIDG